MKKRSVRIAGHQTSITLEDEFWSALQTIAQKAGLSINKIVETIDKNRNPDQNLSSAIRIFILQDLQANH